MVNEQARNVNSMSKYKLPSMSESILQTRNDGKKLMHGNERGFRSVKIVCISEYGGKWERID